MDKIPLLRNTYGQASLGFAALGLAALLAGCAATGPRHTPTDLPMRVTEHREADDLLTAGLGLDGLRVMTAPAFVDPERPTPAELRRRAIWSNWRGIVDLSVGGGYGTLYGSVANVPGREFSALATVPGARQPHRVLAQVPDAFDLSKRCVVVTASSGSRGIYGAIAVAGAWGLPKGCAVAYTDKGAGTDYVDLAAGPGAAGDAAAAFAPATPATSGIAFKHAHSQDNPEADWGRHVRQAADFALQSLNAAFPDATPFDFDNTRVIAVGISNGGGAVLRAAELEGDSGRDKGWLDAVVAGEPNVAVAGARPLFDVTTEAALLMPCALPHLGLPPMPYAAQRCAALAQAGLISGGDLEAQQQSAYDTLRASGWSDEALRAGAISVAFDLWRAVAVTYASAYGRYAAGAHPCGFDFSALEPDLSTRAATSTERAAWWSDASGIPPGNGVAIVDGQAGAAPDTALPGLHCLRALWSGQGTDAQRVRAGIAESRAGLPRKGLPVVVIHGLDDGLVPIAFTSAPYVAAARDAGRDVRYWQVRNAQHFDAFLGFPQYGALYLPLLPYVYAALDRVEAHLDSGTPLPADAVIATTPRGAGQALEARHLAMPE